MTSEEFFKKSVGDMFWIYEGGAFWRCILISKKGKDDGSATIAEFIVISTKKVLSVEPHAADFGSFYNTKKEAAQAYLIEVSRRLFQIGFRVNFKNKMITEVQGKGDRFFLVGIEKG